MSECIEYLRKELMKKVESYKTHLKTEVQAVSLVDIMVVIDKAEKKFA